MDVCEFVVVVLLGEAIDLGNKAEQVVAAQFANR